MKVKKKLCFKNLIRKKKNVRYYHTKKKVVKRKNELNIIQVISALRVLFFHQQPSDGRNQIIRIDRFLHEFFHR
jgi:hypothetical protein